jgi:DNA polymerase II
LFPILGNHKVSNTWKNTITITFLNYPLFAFFMSKHESINGFIIHPTYKVENGKAFVHLYGKLQNGESFLIIQEYRPYFYIKKEDLKKAKDLEAFDVEENHAKNFAGEELAKIILHIPKDVAKMRDFFATKNIQSYEADIRFPYRFMLDHDIKGSLEISGEYAKGEKVDRIYTNPAIKPSTYIPKLSIMSIDIETDPMAKEIFCISIVTDNYEKVLIHSNEKLKNALSYPTEKDLLSAFLRLVIELDPDVITGWNLINFDIKVIEQRCKKFNIPFVMGRNQDELSLKVYGEFMRESQAEVSGRIVLDGIHLLKISFISMQEYTLEYVSQQILGEKKLIGKENKGQVIVDAFKKDPQKLVDYNLKDSQLVLQILKKTGVMDLTIQRSLLTGMQLDRVNASVASLDSLYIRETKKRNIVCTNSGFAQKEKPITGGFVRDSVPGLYENIVVLDFKSLYPSIMRTFNIDPYSYLSISEKEAHKHPETYVVTPNGAVFKNEIGILPGIIQTLWAQREQARKQKNELARHAIKILMNSFFGVLANPSCRFFSMQMSNAITTSAQFVIKLTAQKIQEKGYEVIYGDTDSVFIKSNKETLHEAEKLGEELQEYINTFYKEYIAKEFHRESFLELELDKVFKNFLMPKIRGTEIGAKKRYAGIVEEQGKEKLEFTGLEAIRSDWTELAKKFQEELLMKIFKREKYVEYIKKTVEDLKKKKYDGLLVYRRKINKPLSEYTKTTPPHVKAARKLAVLRSNLIQYVMTTDGPEPLEHIKHDIDYDHYIEKQLKPIADSILSFLNTDFEGIMSTSRQRSLGDY